MYYDYVIIGGGAAGMCTAINLKRNNNKVLIIDHNERIGKKILSTGNGRCNLTNEFCRAGLLENNPEGIYPYYTSGDRLFIEKILSGFDSNKTLKWFESLGLLTVNKNGLIYPVSEQASTVLDTLRVTVTNLGIDVKTGFTITSVIKQKDAFVINNHIACKFLVLCAGGAAAPKSGSDGSAYKIAKYFGHTIINPLPALCGIKLKSDSFKTMQGVRSDCTLRLYDDNRILLSQVKGNVQFNSYGISGVPAMNISSIVSRNLLSGNKLKINIEFLPDYDFDFIVNHIVSAITSISLKAKEITPIDFCLNGILNKKITAAFLKELGLSPESTITNALKKFSESKEYNNGKHCAKYLTDLNPEKIFAARFTGIIKHFSTDVTGVRPFEEAQVTSGGVSTDEINPENMESKIMPGLFFAGEIIDVDGICGGYNLQWAWSSAMNVKGK